MPDTSWPHSRVYHRQTYIDLIHAYLRDYGSQAKLARAVGLTEAYVSYLLAPFGLVGKNRYDTYWGHALDLPAHQVADDLKYLKTPSQVRADQIAEHLCSDNARRNVLLHHIRIAGQRTRPAHPAPRSRLDLDDIENVLSGLRDMHAVALYDTDPERTREAYHGVWQSAALVVDSIDSSLRTTQYAQVLMFLHDTASVLDRQDLALGYARKATLAINARHPTGAGDDNLERLRINALLAEAVSLNTLGLWHRAMIVARQAETERYYAIEPEHWKRSFLEQQLTSMAAIPRASIYLLEKIADEAQDLVPNDAVRRAGIVTRLANAYLAHGTPRSTRKLSRLVEALAAVATGDSGLSPLRRVQILHTMTRYYRAIGDRKAEHEGLGEFLRTASSANLTHQRNRLLRDLR